MKPRGRPRQRMVTNPIAVAPTAQEPEQPPALPTEPLHKQPEPVHIKQDEPMHNPAPMFTNLAAVRNAALDAQADSNRTIAELEAWADEIARTLAFLKAGKQ